MKKHSSKIKCTDKLKRWTEICTHKDADIFSFQQSALCPYHDAIAFCIVCSAFVYPNNLNHHAMTVNGHYIFTLEKLKKEQINNQKQGVI